MTIDFATLKPGDIIVRTVIGEEPINLYSHNREIFSYLPLNVPVVVLENPISFYDGFDCNWIIKVLVKEQIYEMQTENINYRCFKLIYD